MSWTYPRLFHCFSEKTADLTDNDRVLDPAFSPRGATNGFCFLDILVTNDRHAAK